MIVKGHDFPNVTLVGVLVADLSLCSEDYRERKRPFSFFCRQWEEPGEERAGGGCDSDLSPGALQHSGGKEPEL